MEALLGAFGPSIIRKGRVFGSVDSGAVLLVSEDTVNSVLSLSESCEARSERNRSGIFMVFSANFKIESS